jgi:hypothetical protein
MWSEFQATPKKEKNIIVIFTKDLRYLWFYYHPVSDKSIFFQKPQFCKLHELEKTSLKTSDPKFKLLLLLFMF